MKIKFLIKNIFIERAMIVGYKMLREFHYD